jgi:hypothetical protein
MSKNFEIVSTFVKEKDACLFGVRWVDAYGEHCGVFEYVSKEPTPEDIINTLMIVATRVKERNE